MTAPDNQQPDAPAPAPAPALPQFVTPLAPIGQQVGAHVIAALQHPNTVAVLTTVAAGPDGTQQIISIGLDAERMEQIERLLASANRDHASRVQCFGFHCRFEDDGHNGPAAA
ncbi:MAG TPA: hypothetical protein VML55_22485 [Planctomycetaceae bacterium]|nr:hypothetical protein [Planctomycetaceae bacterium]